MISDPAIQEPAKMASRERIHGVVVYIADRFTRKKVNVIPVVSVSDRCAMHIIKI